MAKQVIALEATLNSGPAEGSVKSLKAQLREAQQEVQQMSDKFGLTSDQAQKAARRAAELKDAIGDAKLLTDAFNPDAKFKSFSNAIQGVVGGFAALQGAQALFGSESEDVAKVLAKVQGAMALSQGINSVLEAKDAFKVLGGVIKTNVVGAFSSMKAAIVSTGIGALIVGIGLLIEQFMAMSDAAEEAAEAQKKLNEQTKKYAEEGLKAELDYLNRSEKLEIAKAKLAGKTEEEIFAIQQSYRASRIRSQGRAYEELKNIDAKAADELKNQIKNANVEGQVAEIEHQTKLQETRKKASEERRQKQKEENDKIKEDIKNANAEQNNLQKQLQDEITLSLIEDERQREQVKLEMDLEKAKKDVENSKASTKEKNETIALLEQQYMVNLRAMQDKFAQEDKEKEDKKKQDLINSEQELNDIIEGLYKENLEDQKKKAEEEKKIAESVAIAKVQFIRDIGNATGALSELVGKQTAVGKGLAVAQATINTYQGATEVLRAKSVLPEPLGTISKVVNVATIIATGLKSVKGILSTKVPGGGGGGGNLPSLPSPSTTAPIAPQLGQTALNQQLVNQTGNAAVRAFVLETDVSGNQERIKRLNRAARIN